MERLLSAASMMAGICGRYQAVTLADQGLDTAERVRHSLRHMGEPPIRRIKPARPKVAHDDGVAWGRARMLEKRAAARREAHRKRCMAGV
jgi:hypothetical protein